MAEKIYTDAAGRVLIKDVDYYVDNGRWVFTAAYHLKRGYCCENDCRHCPYRDSSAARHASDRSASS